MGQQSVAMRYARALHEESAGEARIRSDMHLIGATLQQSTTLAACLQSPVLEREAKLAAVQAVFADRLHPLSTQFLKLVIERRREEQLQAMVHAYAQLCDAESGITTAHVRTCHELSERQKADLTTALEQHTGHGIRLEVQTDSTLMGGMVVRVGDVVFDGSVSHQLERLRSRMSQAQGTGLQD